MASFEGGITVANIVPPVNEAPYTPSMLKASHTSIESQGVTSSTMVGKSIPKKTVAQMKVTPHSRRNRDIQGPLLRFDLQTTKLIGEGKVNPKTYLPTARMNKQETYDYVALLSETARYVLNTIPFSHDNAPAIMPVAWGGKKLGKFISHVKKDLTVSSLELATCSFSCYSILAKIDPKKGAYFYHMAKFMIDAKRVEERHLRRSDLDKQVCAFKQSFVTSELRVYRLFKRKANTQDRGSMDVRNFSKKHLYNNRNAINARIRALKRNLKTLKNEEKIIRKIGKSHKNNVKNVNRNAQNLLLKSIDGGYSPANDLYRMVGGKPKVNECLYGVSIPNPSFYYTEAKEYYHEYLRNAASARDYLELFEEVGHAHNTYMDGYIEHFNINKSINQGVKVPFPPPVDATTSTKWGERWLYYSDSLYEIITLDNSLSNSEEKNGITVGINSSYEKRLVDTGALRGIFTLQASAIAEVEKKIGYKVKFPYVAGESYSVSGTYLCWKMTDKGSKLAYMIRHIRDTLRVKLEERDTAMLNFSGNINSFLKNTTGVSASISEKQDTPRGIKAKLYLYRASFNALCQHPMLSKTIIDIDDSSNVPTQAQYPIDTYSKLFYNLRSFLDTHPNHSAASEAAWMAAQVGYVIYKFENKGGIDFSNNIKEDIERYCNIAKSRGVVFPSATTADSTTTTWSEFTDKLEQTAMYKVVSIEDAENETDVEVINEGRIYEEPDSQSEIGDKVKEPPKPEVPLYEELGPPGEIGDKVKEPPKPEVPLYEELGPPGKIGDKVKEPPKPEVPPCEDKDHIYATVKKKTGERKDQNSIPQPQSHIADDSEVSISSSVEAPPEVPIQIPDLMKEMNENIHGKPIKNNSPFFSIRRVSHSKYSRNIKITSSVNIREILK